MRSANNSSTTNQEQHFNMTSIFIVHISDLPDLVPMPTPPMGVGLTGMGAARPLPGTKTPDEAAEGGSFLDAAASARRAFCPFPIVLSYMLCGNVDLVVFKMKKA